MTTTRSRVHSTRVTSLQALWPLDRDTADESFGSRGDIMKSQFAATLFGLIAASSVTAAEKPTIVLVHGAFADSSSWNGVIKILEKDGFPVVAVANPLRGVRSDARYVADIVNALDTPVVLV